MAPEIYERRPYDGERVDVFALGVTMFIMMTRNPPFGAANRLNDRLYNLISTDNLAAFWRIHGGQLPEGEEYFSAEFRDLFEKMTRYNPEERLTIA